MTQTFTMQTRTKGEVEFIAPQFGGYVRIWDADKDEYVQVGKDGGFWGEMLSCQPDRLEVTARKWWKRHLAYRRTVGA